jgi:DNA-binding transcriptional ArsR family regulator
MDHERGSTDAATDGRLPGIEPGTPLRPDQDQDIRSLTAGFAPAFPQQALTQALSQHALNQHALSQHAMTQPIYKLKAEFFKTLGHPARIRILELLADGERSVGELQPELGLESSHLSQQLAVLRRAGVVVARKQGSFVIYSIASADLADLLQLARKILTGVLTDQLNVLNELRADGGTTV